MLTDSGMEEKCMLKIDRNRNFVQIDKTGFVLLKIANQEEAFHTQIWRKRDTDVLLTMMTLCHFRTVCAT